MAGSWDTDLILVALEGDVEPGMTVPLDPERPLAVGRSAKGLQLPDPLVSIHHAQIGFDMRRGYFVKDLDSATGTWVDEELIQKDSRPIGIGTRLRFGDSSFEVRVQRRFSRGVLWAMAAAVSMCGLAFMVWMLAGLTPPPEPILVYESKIRQSTTYSSEHLKVPLTFARERGLKISDLRIKRVTDGDYDGIHEVWLREGTKRDIIITFNPDGSWRQIGELPVDCHDEGEGLGRAEGFVAQNCAGVTYLYMEGEYRVARHSGVVVWTRPREARASEPEEGGAPGDEPTEKLSTELLPDVPLKPLRAVMRDSTRMAGFLNERGIKEPVHYIICEDAFPNIKAQVLTAMGKVKQLAFGCVRHINLLDYEEGRPVAVAFTANGREALLADVTSFYGGNPDAIFVDEHRELLDAAARSPGYERGALKLSAEGMPEFVDPIPQERPLGAGRMLASKDPRNPGSEPATVATISSEGVADLDPDGCTVLRVTTQDFNCYGACTGGSTFMTVDEVGCGEPRTLMTLPYSGGTVQADVDRLQIRARVDASSIAGRYRVDHARIAWRTVGR